LNLFSFFIRVEGLSRSSRRTIRLLDPYAGGGDVHTDLGKIPALNAEDDRSPGILSAVCRAIPGIGPRAKLRLDELPAAVESR
jgi:hypothetical protein